MSEKHLLYRVGKLTKEIFLDIEKFIKTYRLAIEQHVERRMICFFTQAMDVYNSGIKFEIGPKLDQGESSMQLRIYEGHKMLKSFVHQSAHSSTIPCLQMSGKKGNKEIFLHDSDHYRLWNSTMNLPKEVNDADRELDEKWKTKSILRDETLKCLDKSAMGTLDPLEASRDFLTHAITVTDSRLNDIKTIEKNKGTIIALRIYLMVFTELEKEARKANFFDHLCDMKLQEKHRGGVIEDVIRENTFRTIRNLHLSQSSMRNIISEAREDLRLTLKADYGRLPDNYDVGFNRLLLEEKVIAEKRRMYIKDIGVAPCHNVTRRVGNTIEIIKGYQDIITQLATQLQSHLEIIKKEEINSKLNLVCEIRKAFGWSYKKLSEKIKLLRSNVPSSASTLSRIIRGKRPFPPFFLEAFAEVIKEEGIKPSLFDGGYFLT